MTDHGNESCEYCEGKCVRPMKHNKKRAERRWSL